MILTEAITESIKGKTGGVILLIEEVNKLSESHLRSSIEELPAKIEKLRYELYSCGVILTDIADELARKGQEANNEVQALTK